MGPQGLQQQSRGLANKSQLWVLLLTSEAPPRNHRTSWNTVSQPRLLVRKPSFSFFSEDTEAQRSKLICIGPVTQTVK